MWERGGHRADAKVEEGPGRCRAGSSTIRAKLANLPQAGVWATEQIGVPKDPIKMEP